MLRATTIALLLASACAPDQSAVARAVESARPHLAAFADFDRWARRARASSHRRESLLETSFAPLRLEHAVLGAWIEVEGGHPPLLSWPPRVEYPGDLELTAVRDADLGSLDVHAAAPCPVVVRRGRGAAPESCVVLSRQANTTAGERMRVTVAFRPAPRNDGARAQRGTR